MSRHNRTLLLCLSLLAVNTFAAASGADVKFRAVSGPEPVVGHYLVTLDGTVAPDLASAAAEALARAYAGQLEPFASSDVRQFAITMLPSRARTLSADPRVREVAEIPRADERTAPPPSPASATLTRQHLVPIAQDSTDSGTYLYDGSGNIKFIGADSFTYDSVGRLTVAVVQGNQQSYTYDAFGNRTGATRAGNAVGCAGGTTCEAAVTVLGQSNHLSEQTYDLAGNVTAGFGASYTYDGSGMVTSATVGSDIRDFAYTADDERIAVRQGFSWTWTIRDQGQKVLREFTSPETSSSPLALGSHTWSKDYVWRDGQLLASVSQTASGPTIFHYHLDHLDHLGTPRLITGNGGSLIAKHAYYPFGAEMATTPTETSAEPMKFTGHERDIVAGDNHSVDYMHARYYTSAWGRFLSIDPVLGDASTPQSWNRYSYVRNNPINRTDPDGRFDWDFQKVMKDLASAVGIHWMNDTAARSAYNAAKAQLVQGSPGAAAARTAAKVAAREMTSPAGAKLAETMRPIADEASRVGGSVAKGNAAVDAAFVSTAARTAGPVLAAASVGVSVVRIANAPEGQGYRTMAGESGALLGAVSFGQGGAWAGAAAGAAIGSAFGGVGAVPGAIIGGLVGLAGGGIGGGYLGEQVGHNIYDATVPPQ